jgi:hypothetical protein
MYYLYGAPHSAFTAKARSYLIKQGIPFEERAFGHPRFMRDIVPATQRLSCNGDQVPCFAEYVE